jgi:hypothetical protein
MTTAADRRWFAAVAGLEYCRLCGAAGVQVAHRNEGKGIGLKTPAHMTAALCPRCHAEIDSGKNLLRDERRALIDRAIVLTHDALIRAGKLKLEG